MAIATIRIEKLQSTTPVSTNPTSLELHASIIEADVFSTLSILFPSL